MIVVETYSSLFCLAVLVTVFQYGYISVTINAITLIFYTHLPKDMNKTLQRFFVKKIVFIVNLSVFDLDFF